MKNLENRKMNNSVTLDFRAGSVQMFLYQGMSYTMGIEGKLKAFTLNTHTHKYLYIWKIHC